MKISDNEKKKIRKLVFVFVVFLFGVLIGLPIGRQLGWNESYAQTMEILEDLKAEYDD